LGHSDIAVLRKKDPGEKFPWKYLSKNRIGIWHTLNKQDLIKNRKLKIDKIEENIFFNNLFKVGYSKKYTKDISKNKYLIELAKISLSHLIKFFLKFCSLVINCIC
jgi:N-acetylmuramoyl-L-alanine amidase